jgi:hypothetical protein
MKSTQKIFEVLHKINEIKKISYNTTIKYHLNFSVVGAGIIFGDDEIKILQKLDTEKAINIIEVDQNLVKLELSKNFYFYYYSYMLRKFDYDFWIRITNPFWIIYSILLLVTNIFKYFYQKNRSATILMGLLSLFLSLLSIFGTDYNLLYENLIKFFCYIFSINK